MEKQKLDLEEARQVPNKSSEFVVSFLQLLSCKGIYFILYYSEIKEQIS